MTIRWGQNTIPNGNPDFAFTGAGIDVFLTGTGNSTTISDCVITENTNVNAWGGGINVDSGTSGLPGDPAINTTNRGNVNLTRCTVTNNKARLDGAGINLYSDIHNVTLTDCVVTGNSTTAPAGTAANGAGIDIRHSYGGTVTITGGSVSNNTSSGAGGGIDIAGNQNVSMSGVTLSGNTSLSSNGSGYGGGLLIACLGVAGFTPTISVSNCSITGNHAENGAAGQGGGVTFNSAYSATLSNCTISGNSADTGAGVMDAGTAAGTSLTLNSCAISSNTAGISGGGIANINAASVCNPQQLHDHLQLRGNERRRDLPVQRHRLGKREPNRIEHLAQRIGDGQDRRFRNAHQQLVGNQHAGRRDNRRRQLRPVPRAEGQRDAEFIPRRRRGHVPRSPRASTPTRTTPPDWGFRAPRLFRLVSPA